MPTPLKVLFAEPPASRRVGGVETALSGLARSLPAAGVLVTRADELTENLVAAADIVHFHGIWEPSHHRARRWCQAIGKPFLVSPHGMLEPWAFRHRGWKKRPYFHFIERQSLARGKVILATSEDEAANLRRWFPNEQLRVLPLGLERPEVPDHEAARRQLGWPDGERTVLFLSRLHTKKGLHLLIEALTVAAPRLAHAVHLVIVGDGDSRYVTPLKRQTNAWRDNLRATWAGAAWGPEKWDYLSGAHLLCLPSYSENFGLVVLESLFAGTPVLTTPHTPWSSLRGSLPVRLSASDIPVLAAALSAEISRPVPTRDERADTREAAAAAFSWTGLAPRYAALYRELKQPA